MAEFKIAFALTMGNEGGYGNVAEDTGGETYKGISRNNFPQWLGWVAIDQIKAQTTAKGDALALFVNKVAGNNAALQALVFAFYKANFWDINKLDQVVSQSIGNEVFDTGVNLGYKMGALFVQRALNLCNKNAVLYPDIVDDGAIGPITLNLLNNKANQNAVLNTMNMLQGEYYLNIMRSKKTQEKFWPAWLSRVVVNGKW